MQSIFTEDALLRHDVITSTEEDTILQAINAGPWSHGIGRRVQHYGYRYDYRARAAARATPAAPFPAWADLLAERLADHFDQARPEQCIVNEYAPGEGIGMHADAGSFGPVVVSVSLADEWPMRFRPASVRPYRRDGTHHDEVVLLPRRSAIVLRGRARTHWMHGICRNDSRTRIATRISATFRTMAR